MLILGLLFVVALIKASAKEDTDYCAIAEDHFLCEPSPYAKCPENFKYLPQEEIHREAILHFFNHRRNKVARGNMTRGGQILPRAARMLEMKWCSECERVSRKFASTCHGNINNNPGLCKARVIDGLQIFTVVSRCMAKEEKEKHLRTKLFYDLWTFPFVNEKGFNLDLLKEFKIAYIFDNGDYEYQKYGYILRLLNDKTNMIGCTVVLYPMGMNSSMLGAELYCALGAYEEIYGQPVYEEGKPCSKCPTGSKCSTEFTSLCDCSVECSRKLISKEDPCDEPSNQADYFVFRNAATKHNATKNRAKRDNATKDNTTKDKTMKSKATKDEARKDKALRYTALIDKASRYNVTKDKTIKDSDKVKATNDNVTNDKATENKAIEKRKKDIIREFFAKPNTEDKISVHVDPSGLKNF